MNRIFADSYFFFAVLNPQDMEHSRAIDFARQNRGPLVTTAWVLTEVADGLACTARRQVFRRVLDDLEGNKANLIVPAVVMSEEQVTEALTGDRHFEQAGFKALLK